ncbi:MAG: hypothetical protein HY509_04110, partial [Acidobacteria bacterium]|nr:hypothetical protein [Acidobacteriota bacterium]
PGWRSLAVLLGSGASTALLAVGIGLILPPLAGTGNAARVTVAALFLGCLAAGIRLAGPFHLPPPPAYLGALELLKAIWGPATVWGGPAVWGLLGGIWPAESPILASLARWSLAGLLLLPLGVLAGLSVSASLYRVATGGGEPRLAVSPAGAAILIGAAGGFAVAAHNILPRWGVDGVVIAGGVLAACTGGLWWAWGREGPIVVPAAEARSASPPLGAALFGGILLGVAVPPGLRILGLLLGPTWETSQVGGLAVLLGASAGWIGTGPARRPAPGRSPGAGGWGGFLLAGAGLFAVVFLVEPLAGVLPGVFGWPEPAFSLARILVEGLFFFPIGAAAGAAAVHALVSSLGSGSPEQVIPSLPAAAILGVGSGMLLGAWFGLPWIGSRGTLLLVGIACWAAGLASLRAPAGSGALRRLGVPSAAGLAGIAATLLAPDWSAGVLTAGGYRYAGMIAAEFPRGGEFLRTRRSASVQLREGTTAVAAVEEGKEAGREGLFLTVDGSVEESWSPRTLGNALASHAAMLLRPAHPERPRVALLGLGAGVAAKSVLLHEPESLAIVEPERRVLGFLEEFASLPGRILADPRVESVRADPRAFWTFADRDFDLIVSRGPEPWLARGAPLHTRDFFRACRRHLASGGIQAHQVPLSGLGEEDVAGIAGAFLSVYPHAAAIGLTNRDLLLLGSTEEWRIPVPELRRRFVAEAVIAELTRLGVPAPNSVLGRFVAGSDDLLRLAGDAVPLTDRRLPRLVLPRRGPPGGTESLWARLDALGTRIVPFLEPEPDPGEQAHALYELAKTLTVRGAYGLVEDVAADLARLGFAGRSAWLNGQVAFHRGDRERALALWEGVLAAEPENLDALMSLGGYYQDFNLYHAAEPYLERLERAYPEKALALFHHGKNLYFLLRDGEASERLERVVEAGGAVLYPSTFYYLGMLAKRNARSEAAVEYLTRFLQEGYRSGELSLVEAEAHLTLAEVLRRLERTEEADRHAEAGRRLAEGLLALPAGGD